MSSIIFPKDVVNIIATKLESDRNRELASEYSHLKDVLTQLCCDSECDAIMCGEPGCRAYVIDVRGHYKYYDCDRMYTCEMEYDHDCPSYCDAHRPYDVNVCSHCSWNESLGEYENQKN